MFLNKITIFSYFGYYFSYHKCKSMLDKTFKSFTDYRYTLKLGLKIFTFKTIFMFPEIRKIAISLRKIWLDICLK